ncbi:2-hydroxyacid dehydrogenase [Granulosicoccus antarcticus]|uniref:Glycerate dehydrogenase n=1 Tax=Granulosicoccus antarcticus IMCC3135 TaxID=1192854 RepID=A0A2Z2P6S0_9GAMM|nr:D-glycerate dehydrogenase [Granulosicoccus antarcticus]ASJ76387.1 Glycerate dehydrogenase [Granulosicoccus antarcticus IMCC3135]
MSSKPVVWITRTLSANTLERARAHYSVIFDPSDTPADAATIIARSAEVDAIIPCHSEAFTAEVVAQLSDRVKIIANHSVGVDHCDLNALQQRGIVVTNTPDVLSDATAEIAMLLLLGAARRAAEGDHMIRSGEWKNWSPSFMVGHQVTGKRIGIIGMGKVGQVMARRARGFDMEVHYHNRKRLSVEDEQGAIFHETLDTLLPQAQFLSLHCPTTDTTRGMINQDTLSALPQGAILINTARGPLIDEAALLAAIESGQLAAAGLDCFVNEPGGNTEFSKYKQIFMLPHIGSATFETRDAMGYRALDNLDAFFAGKEPTDRLV